MIQPDIARRLREQGFDRATVYSVGALEREMAARWESLDPERVLLSEMDPALRNGYIAVWMEHREVFGYSLFAEMPYHAATLLEDHDQLSIGALDCLIVDEYQDLNRSEIALLEALAPRPVAILAVGDDDQSIYSWRMADPRGILEFPSEFETDRDYTLSRSFRCGKRILDVACELIETMPGRQARPSLLPGDANPDGVIEYLRFEDDEEEQRGVAALIAYLLQFHELPPEDVAVLVRSDFNSWWSDPLRTALAEYEIPAVDIEEALSPLSEGAARRVMAVARLANNRTDDLAWWTLLRLTPGIAAAYINAIYADAATASERFSQRVVRLDSPRPSAGSDISHKRAVGLATQTLSFLNALDVEAAPASDVGWAEWVIDTGTALGIDLSDDFQTLARRVGAVTPQDLGLGHYLNQLEPVAKDLALRTNGVPIMTMARAKGLTFRAVIVMGVEEGVVPSPRATDENEERRLLYVSITRAQEFCYLTMARRRTGPTARSGQANVGWSRSRSPLMRSTSLVPLDGAKYVKRILRREGAAPTST